MAYIITYGSNQQNSVVLHDVVEAKGKIISLIGSGYAIEEIQLYRASEIAGVDLSFSWISLGDGL